MPNPTKKHNPQKVGRKPKNYKPIVCQSLQIKTKKIKLTFDENVKGDLKDFMKANEVNQKKH